MPTQIYNQGDIYFCDPDPQVKDTVGVEHKGDHVWVIVSVARCHRRLAVVGLPLSRHLNKAGGHLTQIPSSVINYDKGEDKLNRVALTDQIRVLDKTRLRRKLGTVSKQGMSAVFQGLDALFGRDVITTPSAKTIPSSSAKTDKLFKPTAPAPTGKHAPFKESPPGIIPGNA